MSGLDIAKKIGLDIKKDKITFETVRCKVSVVEIEKFLAEKFRQAEGIFVAWQIQNIVFGKINNGKLMLKNGLPEIENFLECRIFNEIEELHLKNISGEFRGRYVIDGIGEEKFFADSFARFWGKFQSYENGFAKLVDSERKLCLEIPTDVKAEYYGLLTRNYIDSDKETGLSGYADYRFLKIEGADVG